MKITIDRSDLLETLNQCAKACARTSPIPQVTMLLLQPVDGMLRVAGTNAELTIIKLLDCKISGDERSICVPPELIKNIIGNLNEEIVVLNIKENVLVVESGEVKATIKGLPAIDFPQLPEKGEKIFTLTPEMLKTIRELFVPFCANDGAGKIAHPWLQGILVKCENNNLVITSGNGYRYSFWIEKMEHPDFMIVVPEKSISECKDMGKADVYLNDVGTQVVVADDITTISSTLYEPLHVDLTKHIRGHGQGVTQYRIGPDKLLRAVKMANTLSDDTSKKIAFDVSKDGLSVSVKSQKGEYSEQIGVSKFEGPNHHLSFDGTYWSQILSALGQKEIEVNCVPIDVPNPILQLEVVGEKRFTHFIMPMRD